MALPAYNLSMDATDERWLFAHRGSDRCFPCSLRIDGCVKDGWIGFRGRYSRWFRKPSFDCWFTLPGFSAGQVTVHLNASYRDPSFIRSRLSFQTFADLGLPVPRCHHAWVTVNGRELGLYTVLESVDARWLGRNGIEKGSIYYAVGTQGNFGQLNPETGRRKRHLAVGYEKCHPWDDDFSEIESLIRSITLPADNAFEIHIDSLIDVDMFLRWLVGVTFTNHTDGLVQNYALIHPDGARWLISPWDCDGTWGRVPDGTRIRADEMPPEHGAENYLIARLLRMERWRRQYLAEWEQALAGPLRIERIAARIDTLYNEIRAAARQDHRKRWSNTTFARERTAIVNFARDRRRFVQERFHSIYAGLSGHDHD